MDGEVWLSGEGIKVAIPGRKRNMSKYTEVQMSVV